MVNVGAILCDCLAWLSIYNKNGDKCNSMCGSGLQYDLQLHLVSNLSPTKLHKQISCISTLSYALRLLWESLAISLYTMPIVIWKLKNPVLSYASLIAHAESESSRIALKSSPWQQKTRHIKRLYLMLVDFTRVS